MKQDHKDQHNFFKKHFMLAWSSSLTLPREGCFFLTIMTSSLPYGSPSSTNSSDSVLRAIAYVAVGKITANEM